MQNVKIKEVKLVSGRGLNVSYTERAGDGSTEDVSRKCSSPVHDDLLDAFKSLAPHLGIIAEYIKPGKKFDIENPEDDLIDNFRVSSITIEDETTGVSMSGSFKLSTGKTLSISLPTIKFSEKKPYAYAANLAEIVEIIKTETEAYLNGKHAPDNQTKLEFPGEEQTSI